MGSLIRMIFTSRRAGLVCVAAMWLATGTFAQQIKLSRSFGPPTTRLLVSGSNLTPNDAADIFFDTTDVGLAQADSSGNFSNAPIKVPASAPPGRHSVTAVCRNTAVKAESPFLVRTDWPQFGFNPGGTRNNFYENVLNPSNVGSLVLDWSFPAGGGSPAVANGLVYINAGVVYAFDATTGAKRWSSLPLGGQYTSPAVADGMVFSGGSGHENDDVVALDANTGVKKWSFATSGSVFSSPAEWNCVVYIGSGDGNVYALDAFTGTRLWSFATGGPIGSSPAVANGVVYIGSHDSNVYALNATTGAKLWSFTTLAGVESSPAVANGVVYIGSGPVGDNRLYALNATTGAKLWSFAAGIRTLDRPAVANGVVYIGSYGTENVYALNATTGAKLWTFVAGSGSAATSPAVANGVVYINWYDIFGHSAIYALNAATGAKLWSAPFAGQAASSPAVANGAVYSVTPIGVVAFHVNGQ